MKKRETKSGVGVAIAAISIKLDKILKDLEKFATKDDLQKATAASKQDPEKATANMATKQDLQKAMAASKQDLEKATADVVTNSKFEKAMADVVTKAEFHKAVSVLVTSLVTKVEFYDLSSRLDENFLTISRFEERFDDFQDILLEMRDYRRSRLLFEKQHVDLQDTVAKHEGRIVKIEEKFFA